LANPPPPPPPPSYRLIDRSIERTEQKAAKPSSGHAHMGRVKSNSAKQLVASREVERLKAVASHPSFQQDPHAALREHLKATLAAQIAQQRAVAAVAEGPTQGRQVQVPVQRAAHGRAAAGAEGRKGPR
jgi:hypothetical protein